MHRQGVAWYTEYQQWEGFNPHNHFFGQVFEKFAYDFFFKKIPENFFYELAMLYEFIIQVGLSGVGFPNIYLENGKLYKAEIWPFHQANLY